LDSTITPSSNITVTSLASFDVVKWISSVLAKSNYIMFSEASLYSISTSRYSILVFFRRLVDFVVIEISSRQGVYISHIVKIHNKVRHALPVQELL
jgi:hypothetical protein